MCYNFKQRQGSAMVFSGRNWTLKAFGEPSDGAPLILLLAGRLDELFPALAEKLVSEGVSPLWIASPSVDDWDNDFTPWRVESPNGRIFGGGADALLPSVEAAATALRTELHAGKVFIAGYSLGGLAAMYFHTKLGLDGCASCSGSLWYPGWTEYLKEHPPTGKVYLSLGGKEKNTTDLLMIENEPMTEKTKAIASKTAERVIYHREPGGHFRDVEGRIARGIKWLCY